MILFKFYVEYLILGLKVIAIDYQQNGRKIIYSLDLQKNHIVLFAHMAF